MSKIRAKPTLYDGIRFRSRLEARWAVFMDALSAGAPRFWTYEPKVPDGVAYLPDFEVRDAYIEVKPISWMDDVHPADQDKFADLIVATGKPVWVFCGEPAIWEQGRIAWVSPIVMLERDGTVHLGSWSESACGAVRVVPVGQSVCDDHAIRYDQIESALNAVRDHSYVDAP